ncbi:MAG: PaaI family thioesterase [Gemmatimonadetes bacterium]|nr:PaaI family thioesterase [Gemmatimonadota bacterium]
MTGESAKAENRTRAVGEDGAITRGVSGDASAEGRRGGTPASGSRLRDGSAPVRGLAANKCFVCGPDNPIGLHLTFRLEDGVCVSEFTPGENHQGYPGVIHGGMLYSALDDVMANWLYLRGARAYTAKCEIRYRTPAREGEKLELVGRQTARKRKLVEMEGIARRASDGEVVAIANATFVVIDEEEFAGVVGS